VPSFAKAQMGNKELDARFRNLVQDQFTEGNLFKWK